MMGIDAQVYVTLPEPLPESELQAIASKTGLRLVTGSAYRDDEVVHTVYWDTLSRYYDKGYERGDWPTIRAALIALREAFPGRPVHYHGDTWDGPLPMTAEYMAELDAHHQGPNGDAYHGVTQQEWTTHD